MIVATRAERSPSLNCFGKSGADRTTLAGEPTARLRGGIFPATSELAPITVPSPIVLPGITNTRQGSQTLAPSVTGSYVTGYPSHTFAPAPRVKMSQRPATPVSAPIPTGFARL